MISRNSHTLEWITQVRKSSPGAKLDPILIEKMIMALTLVEHLRSSRLEFVFKGGTSLALVLKELRRFSIDIDIIVSPNQDLHECFQAILEQGHFSSYEEDQRVDCFAVWPGPLRGS
jgi:hypothetical protein